MDWLPTLGGAAERLERRLGDPEDPEERISFSRSLEGDEGDAYPEDGCRALDAAGLSDAYVPEADGGGLRSIPELASLFRVVARRDLTLAIAHHKTFLGAVHVWTAGNESQRARVAAYVRGGGRTALAYHERDHGSDLMATETSAVPVDGGYRLTGEKWLVNNATRGDLHAVFARTDAKGGARGFSIFLVDKRSLAPGAVEHLPRIKTVGARGADFSGVRYLDALLPADSLVGRLGEGLELTLRSFQITRALVPALATGAADTALRVVVSFARERQLYGGPLLALARPRAALVDAFADLLACECVVAATARALHVVPDEMRLWSAVSKAFVPGATGRAIQSLGEVLGARSFLRDGHRYAVFQKMARDHEVIPLFHAGGFLLLQTVGLGLAQAFAFARNASATEKTGFQETLRPLFAFSEPLPPLDPAKLRPYARVRGLGAVLAAAREALRRETGEVPAALAALAGTLDGALAADALSFDAIRSSLDPNSPQLFDLAERYCVIHAGAVCLAVWLANRGRMDPFFSAGHWLVVALARLSARLGGEARVPSSFGEKVHDHLMCLYDENRAFSIVPWKLSGDRARSPAPS